MVTQVLWIWFAVLLFPPCNEFRFALFTFRKIFWILCFLQRMPVVDDPIRWYYLSFEGAATNTVSNCKNKTNITSYLYVFIESYRLQYLGWKCLVSNNSCSPAASKREASAMSVTQRFFSNR